MTNTIITRFAPSPTGLLHIGGARTALFNYLFAKHHQGKFLLRVEDTDKKRSTEEAKQEIIASLSWLGLNYDDKIFYQSQREERHKEVAMQLLEQGKAYKCFASKKELQEMREKAEKEKSILKYDRRWRYKIEHPANQDFVVRIKAPLDGEIILQDEVQGKVVVKNQEQEDFVILRADGTPTYMLAVVVDDYDMKVSHIIRGDDHLTNSFKQILIYQALNWQIPVFAHIPLIYGTDGKKMSKRYGATSVSDYKKLGYLPETLRNYLLRLGFSHGDDEIISDQQAIKWFSLESVGKSPARFDFKKLDNLNNHYIKNLPDNVITKIILEKLDCDSVILQKLVSELKMRAKNLNELRDSALFLEKNFDIKNNLTEKAKKILNLLSGKQEIIIDFVQNIDEFNHHNIYEKSKIFVEEQDIKLKDLAGFFRAKITGSHISPSVFEIMEVFGKQKIVELLK